jgi:hypothetical protein
MARIFGALGAALHFVLTGLHVYSVLAAEIGSASLPGAINCEIVSRIPADYNGRSSRLKPNENDISGFRAAGR